MGVPKFFRFISERYPLINTPLPSNPPQIDNLYLDMNGIIHNCVRSSPGNATIDTKRYASLPTNRTPTDIYLDVFKYIENLVSSLPPRRLLYMAIDGVAPRAKMNQQRSRRFRSAKERVEEHVRRQREDPMYAAAELDPFDSNCITPGTSFMAGLTVALRYFVARKISDDPSWSHLQIVLSGAEAPGEGEHKIMAYIRAQRESGQLDPNMRHAVYGLDADLIMLALITHEPHFFLLREKIDFNAFWRRGKNGPRVATPLDGTKFGEFELMSIGVLREYIALELGCDGNDCLPYFDVDRITDDFVFFLMLIGNDFLPNLPTLDIADGTLSVMLHLYRRILPLLGGYLTHAGTIHALRFEFLLAKLGLLEEHVLRHRRDESPSGRGGGRRGRGNARSRSFLPTNLDALLQVQKPDPENIPAPLSDIEMMRETEEIRARLAQSNLSSLKEQYYKEKFGQEFWEDPKALRNLVTNYVNGITWTLKYYIEGCRQWRWFYPFHYAPLASDIVAITAMLDRFQQNDEEHTPFLPFEQLLSVLPPASAWCLPKPFRALMTNASSPLADQYPIDFAVDMNGKRNDWEAVVLLPFVDEAKLLDAIKSIPLSELTTQELERNRLGPSILYSYSSSYAEHIESPFGSRLPAFISHAEPEDLILAAIAPGQPFSPGPIPGTKAAGSCEELADLPTLCEFHFKAQLQAVGVNVFGQASKSDSLVLMDNSATHSNIEITDPTNGFSNPETIASPLEMRGVNVGSHVWYGFPWRKAGVVESIANKMVTKRLVLRSGDGPSQPSTSQVTVSSTLASNFEQDASAVGNLLMQKGAVALRKPDEIIVLRTEELNSTPDKENDDSTERVHDRLVKRRDVSHSDHSTRPLAVGQTVMYVGHGAYFAHKCTVVASLGYEVVRVQFHTPIAAAREPPFGYRVVSLSQTQRWMPLTRLAADLGMDPSVVDAFLGSVRVRLNSEKDEIDLGLGVKYVGRGLLVVGYARREERNFYTFSERTKGTLHKYHSTFPGLFDAVGKLKKEELKSGSSGGRSKGTPVFASSDLFNVKSPDEAVKAAAAWLSVQDVASKPLVSVNSDVLASDKVTELERHCQIIKALQGEYVESLGGANPAKTLREVTRTSLLTGREGTEWGTAPSVENGVLQHYEPVSPDAAGLRLGDRVTNRIVTAGIPFGLRGTVIGIHPGEPEGSGKSAPCTTVEVVFDEPFISGGNLSRKCSNGRGKAVAANTLFIIRPDRDNAYYTKHYARVAARLGQQLKSDEGGKQANRLTTAVANAAAASYAEVLKGNGRKKSLGNEKTSQAAPRLASSTQKVVEPQHGAAPLSPSVKSPTSPRRDNGWKQLSLAPPRGPGDQLDVKQGENPSSSPTESDEGPRRRHRGIDARIASVPPPSWVGGGVHKVAARNGMGGSDTSNEISVGTRENDSEKQTWKEAHGKHESSKQEVGGKASAVSQNRSTELEELSEELRRAIGIEKSNNMTGPNAGTVVSAASSSAGTGGSKRRGRRGGRGRNRGLPVPEGGVVKSAAPSGQTSSQSNVGDAAEGAMKQGSTAKTSNTNVEDEFEFSARWEELQEQARANRKR